MGPEKWSPHGGYGNRMSWATHPEKNSKLLNIKIFKLHGSPAFRRIWWDPEHLGDVDLGISRVELPDFHSELGNVNDEGPYFILPSFIKPFEFRGMMELYHEAIEEVKTANRLIIIGSSLRKEDYMLWFILSYFRGKKIITVSPEAESIKESLINILLFNKEDVLDLSGELTKKIDQLQTLI